VIVKQLDNTILSTLNVTFSSKVFLLTTVPYRLRSLKSGFKVYSDLSKRLVLWYLDNKQHL
jgi:hypothetical protein